MKIKNLLCAAMAVLAFASCEEQNLGPEKVEIKSSNALEIPEAGGTVTLEFVATVDWELQGYTDEVSSWLVASKLSGKASADVQKIDFTAESNEGANLVANLSIFGNVLMNKPFTVKSLGPKGDDSTITVQQFIEKADNSKPYRLAGTVSRFNSQYCSFDLEDATGKIYVYSVSNKEEWSGKISNGGTVELEGTYEYYEQKSQHEVINAVILSFTPGAGAIVTPEKPDEYTTAKPTPTKLTIAEFIAKPFSYTDWYELTGEITSLDESNQYGNFTIKDETGSVYIYGMTSKWVGAGNDQSFQSLGLKVTDKVTLGTLRQHNPFTGEVQGGGNWMAAYYISHEEGAGPAELPDGSVVLTFPDDNSANNGLSSAHYETEWTAKIGNYEWKLYAFNNNNWENDWTHVRAGRKNNMTSVATITTTKAMPKISSVIISFVQIDKSLVNSLTLQVYSDAALSTKVGEDIVASTSSLATGDFTLSIPESSQAANQYYKLTFDLKAGSVNGFVRINKVAYVAAE